MQTYRFSIPVCAVLLLLAFSNPAQADKFTDTIAIYEKSAAVRPFLNSAYGYAVFPTIGKGGFVVGAAYGKGLVYRDGKVTGETELVKVSIGFLVGGQAFSEMIFFEDQRAYDEFTSGSFEFDAVASAVAITASIQAKAGTEGVGASATVGPATGQQAKTGYHKGMAVFTHAKGGLMLEAAVGGQNFSFKAKP